MALPVHALGHPGPATRADLDALPPHLKGEIIDGVLYAMTRPRAAHQELLGVLAELLRPPFRHGRGGPGGWWILPEPGIELPDAPEVSPDLAGWRRERLPALPRERAIELVPDWVCELLSPTTRRYDLLIKRPFYARAGVAWLWVVDPEAQTVSVQRLEGGRWLELGIYGDETAARLAPFDAIAIDVARWWTEAAPPG